MKTLLMARVPSPIGDLILVVDGADLCALEFADGEAGLVTRLARRFGPLALVPAADPCGYSSRVRAYLAGDLGALDAIPVRTDGTPFQQAVWAALRRIPPGTVRAYSALAADLGRPAACRAVGLANGQNPVAIVLPCHRVVGAHGALTGYGGGLDRKAWLLRHEGADLPALRR